MIHGLDTGFLVAAEVREHAVHADARATLAQVLSSGDAVAIAPQVLAEFIHVVTDRRRFTQPRRTASGNKSASLSGHFKQNAFAVVDEQKTPLVGFGSVRYLVESQRYLVYQRFLIERQAGAGGLQQTTYFWRWESS